MNYFFFDIEFLGFCMKDKIKPFVETFTGSARAANR